MSDAILDGAESRQSKLFPGTLPGLADEPLETPSLIQRLGYLLTNPGKNYLIPTEWLRALMRTSKSPLIAESFIRPGGWRSMEIVYRNATPIDWLDRQALRDNPIPMAARNRRKLIIDRLTRFLRQQPTDAPVNLLGVGAGPGWHIQTALVESGISPERATAYLIDLDDDAFPYGRSLAEKFGIGDSIRFIKGDVRQIHEVLPKVRFQIVKLVGIIEYLKDEQLIVLFKSIREVMTQNGRLVTHGLVDRYGTGKFLSRVFQLRHYSRDADHLSRLLCDAGFRVDECEYEPTGIHPIITASPNSPVTPDFRGTEEHSVTSQQIPPSDTR